MWRSWRPPRRGRAGLIPKRCRRRHMLFFPSFLSLSFSFCVLATVSALLRSSITDILHQPPRARRQSPAEQRHAYSVTRYARKMGQRRRRRRRGQLEQTWFSQGRTLRIEIAKKPTTREVTFAAPTTVHPPGKETTYLGYICLDLDSQLSQRRSSKNELSLRMVFMKTALQFRKLVYRKLLNFSHPHLPESYFLASHLGNIQRARKRFVNLAKQDPGRARQSSQARAVRKFSQPRTSHFWGLCNASAGHCVRPIPCRVVPSPYQKR